MVFNKAMIMAAGFGKRMRPLTDEMPKPLVPVMGRPVLDYIFDHLAAANIRDVVINGHHLADQIEAYVQNKSDFNIMFSKEDEILETGGGVTKVIDQFGDDPFYVINGDAMWQNASTSIFQLLAEKWDDAKMDVLLGLKETSASPADYFLHDDGRLAHLDTQYPANHMYMGVHAMHPRLLQGEDVYKFSLKQKWDDIEPAGRLHGAMFDGAWYHLSTPADIVRTEEILNDQKAG